MYYKVHGKHLFIFSMWYPSHLITVVTLSSTLRRKQIIFDKKKCRRKYSDMTETVVLYLSARRLNVGGKWWLLAFVWVHYHHVPWTPSRRDTALLNYFLLIVSIDNDCTDGSTKCENSWLVALYSAYLFTKFLGPVVVRSIYVSLHIVM